MLTQTFNELVNPLYPFASITKEWLNGELENAIHQDTEKILMTAHVFLKKNNGLLVISNRRIIIYQTKNNSLLKRAFSFGWDELKGAVIGAIPGVGELMDAKETISLRLNSWKQMLNRKGTKIKEAKEERVELNKLAEILHLPDQELLDAKKFTLIFQDTWDSLAQIIHGIRITKNTMQFELAPDVKTVDQDQYKTLLKKSILFYHQDIGFILSSLFVPYREGLQKRGWDLFFDGENMLITKEKIEDPALEEVMEEVKKANFFGVFPQDFNFDAGVDRPWQHESSTEPQKESPVDLSAFEQGVRKKRKGPFIFKKSNILSMLDAEELSVKLDSFIESMKSESWLSDVQNVYLWPGSNPQLAVLLVQIEPVGKNIDEWFWAFVGKLPEGYLNARFFPTAVSALDHYLKELAKYTKAVHTNQHTDDLLPFINGMEPELAGEWEQILPMVHHFLLQRQLDLIS